MRRCWYETFAVGNSGYMSNEGMSWASLLGPVPIAVAGGIEGLLCCIYHH